MAHTVVHHKTLNQARVERRLVFHEHDLDHVQIDLLVGLTDRQNGVDNDVSQVRGELVVQLGTQRGSGNRTQKLAIEVLVGLALESGLVFAEEFQGRLASQADALKQSARVQ